MAKPRSANAPVILVTDAGRGSALAIIRSLGRKGWRVIAADSDPHSLGFRSRYTWKPLCYPSPKQAPQGCVDALFQAVQIHAVDLIIPVTDEVILPLSAERARFAGLTQLAVAEPAALEVVRDKLKTLELAGQVGVPAPRTALVHTVLEAHEQGQSFSWPIVLKPRVSRLYRNGAAIETYTVCYAETPRQLAQQMARFAGRCPVLLQEYYAGVGEGVELLLHAGRPLAAFQHRRLREVPIHGGASALRESVPLDPTLYDYAVRLLGALRWTGLAMVEFKIGAQGPKLMEINGRVWGSLPLAVFSGMDFPGRLAELYLQGPPVAQRALAAEYTVGVRARNLELEMLWIAAVLRGKRRYPFLPMPTRRQGVAALLELFNPTYKFDILSLTDPGPGLAELPKIIQKLVSKLQSHEHE
jgi:predicted ATP-grasp superfamily ATP-dependent carboligase